IRRAMSSSGAAEVAVVTARAASLPTEARIACLSAGAFFPSAFSLLGCIAAPSTTVATPSVAGSCSATFDVRKTDANSGRRIAAKILLSDGIIPKHHAERQENAASQPTERASGAEPAGLRRPDGRYRIPRGRLRRIGGPVGCGESGGGHPAARGVAGGRRGGRPHERLLRPPSRRPPAVPRNRALLRPS